MNYLKHFLQLVCLTVCVILTGCSSDTEVVIIQDPAPLQVIGKQFALFPSPTRWSVKMYPGDEPSDGLVLINSSEYSVESPNIYYTRTGSATAELNCNFQTKDWKGSIYYEYTCHLSFDTPNEGQYSGTCTYSVGAASYRSEEITGYFTFDTDKLPSVSGKDEEEDKTPSVDYQYLVGSWKQAKGNQTQYLTFYENKTYLLVTTGDATYAEEVGSYTLMAEYDLIQMKAGHASKSYNYHIEALNRSRLEWIRTGKDQKKESYTATSSDGTEFRPSNGNGNNGTESSDETLTLLFGPVESESLSYSLTYSAPSDFTDEADFLTAGIVWSTEPNPLYKDNEYSDALTISPTDTVFHQLKNLKSGTLYYLRPYSMDKGKNITYYKGTTIQTLGGNLTAKVSLKAIGKPYATYSIEREGGYTVRLIIANDAEKLQEVVYEVKGQQPGNKGNMEYRWETAHADTYAYVSIINEASGIEYRSNKVFLFP